MRAYIMKEKELKDSLSEALRTQIQLIEQSEMTQQDERTERSILQEKLRECQKEAEKCKTRQAVAFEDYAEGRIQKQEYLVRKREIAGQQEEIARWYAEISDMLTKAELDKGTGTVDLGRYAFAGELTREMLDELVREVRVGGKDEIEIVWNFKE